ncbi:FAD-binding protein [Candidatus Epulonipiscium viviparus]|uniref:FAD-binding protein n=1 Tax=Candidatus Epulonipiscium viviparus TaxID=420336 RepID=UPI00016C09E4|nr:FAD-binding protein [Candidatus Epulopiscium viviparus]
MNVNILLNGYSGDINKQLLEIYTKVDSRAIKNIVVIGTKQMLEATKKISLCKNILWCELDQDIDAVAFIAQYIEKDAVYICGYGIDNHMLAAKLGVKTKGSTLNLVNEIEVNNRVTLYKNMYGGNIRGKYVLDKYPVFVSVTYSNSELEIKPIADVIVDKLCEITNYKNDINVVKKIKIPEKYDLLNAEKIVLIGNGVKTQNELVLIQAFAKKINAQIAGTRPVVLRGLLPLEALVGVSGNIIRPKLCITIGVSGLPALYEGIEKSEMIVSINNDMNAPIIKKSDKYICEDFKKIIKLIMEENNDVK